MTKDDEEKTKSEEKKDKEDWEVIEENYKKKPD